VEFIDAHPSDHRAQIRIDLVPTTCRPGLPMPVTSARCHRTRVSGRMIRNTVLPDFFIGAHAAVAQVSLLTRGPRRYRTYFSGLIALDELKST